MMAKRGFQGAMMKMFGADDHRITVVGTEDITPDFRRIWCTSATLFAELESGPTAWVRLWLPDKDGADSEHQRGYTIAKRDGERFAIDFVLHEPAGPASAWARRAKVGDEITAMAMATTKFTPPELDPAGYLLIGDAASIPAINTIIESVDERIPIELYLEFQHDSEHDIPLADHPRVHVHRVARTGPHSLVEAIERRDWSNWFAWVCPESASLKALRPFLRDECGFPKTNLYQQAYWIGGKAMGKSRTPQADKQAEATASSTNTEAETPARAARSGQDKAPKGTWRTAAASRLLAPMKGVFLIAGILQALITIIQLIPWILAVELARRMFAGAPAEQIWSLAITALVVLGTSLLAEVVLQLWLHWQDARFSTQIRTALLNQLARLPLGWFTQRASGKIKKLVHDDPLAVHYVVTHAVPDAVAAIVAPIAVLIYLATVDWKLMLLLFVPVFISVFLMYVMIVQSGAQVKAAQQWEARMNAEAASYLDAQAVVRIFGGSAGSTFQRKLGEYLTFLDRWQAPFIGKRTAMSMVTSPATIIWLLAIVGGIRIIAGTLDPIDLLPFFFLGTTVGAKLLAIGYGLGELQSGMQAARTIQDVLETPTLREPTAPTAPHPSGHDVHFEQVNFSYRPAIPVLRDITLTLPAGSLTAVVGPSGAGKSTLAALLARFYDIDSGTITIGGANIAELNADDLYRHVGFVFQDPQLIAATVADNIALARPEASRAEIIAAARAAQIHERITHLPEGYDTPLGAKSALSGGEIQRLTIARALLADTPVVILDEATAFADPQSEYEVQCALGTLMHGRTVMVIAHRLHTVVGADQIVVLEDGKIAEMGTHAELLATPGRYRQLWQAGAVSTGVSS
ncbi:MAG: ATP-binding cassette domain-containing protein [Bowdeniella nasicola]|nr:ATP-binding cassette domain-containing protein [Bowdeniella nasicola]